LGAGQATQQRSWRHLDNVLTYTECPITNAMSEGINSKIQWIEHTARGFRNRERFETAILFHCGNLQLYPHETEKSGKEKCGGWYVGYTLSED
jgi:hypothetical protein